MTDRELTPEENIMLIEFEQRDMIISLLKQMASSLDKIESFFEAKQEEKPETPKFLGTQWNQESAD